MVIFEHYKIYFHLFLLFCFVVGRFFIISHVLLHWSSFSLFGCIQRFTSWVSHIKDTSPRCWWCANILAAKFWVITLLGTNAGRTKKKAVGELLEMTTALGMMRQGWRWVSNLGGRVGRRKILVSRWRIGDGGGCLCMWRFWREIRVATTECSIVRTVSIFLGEKSIRWAHCLPVYMIAPPGLKWGEKSGLEKE